MKCLADHHQDITPTRLSRPKQIQMNDFLFDAIYLSPHLDDAILSCGGQIHMRTSSGETVLIATIFSGYPTNDYLPSQPFRHLFPSYSPVELVRRRRKEDKDACQSLGAHSIHFHHQEAIFRHHNESIAYKTCKDLFRPNPEEQSLCIQTIQHDLRSLPKSKRIFCPLGVGSHVDHLILREAADTVFGTKVNYYTEYPYDTKPKSRSQKQNSRYVFNKTILLDAKTLQMKVNAIMLYETQLPILFHNPRSVEEELTCSPRGCMMEHLWSKNSSIDRRRR